METKGEGFKEKKDFIQKKGYVETEFLRLNREKFGYERFEFLFLVDEDPAEENLAKLAEKLKTFFA